MKLNNRLISLIKVIFSQPILGFKLILFTQNRGGFALMVYVFITSTHNKNSKMVNLIRSKGRRSTNRIKERPSLKGPYLRILQLPGLLFYLQN